MDLGLKGRTALVTGASTGIGLAAARLLAAEGVAVAIVARGVERLSGAADALHRDGFTAHPIAGDMSRPEDADRVCAEAAARLGTVDILVNNAGSAPAGQFAKMSDAAWQGAIDLKLMGYVRAARALVPAMRSRKWGRVVNVIGRRGHVPGAAFVVGGAVNAALQNFTVALALDCAADNVLVNMINPGPILTPRAAELRRQKAASWGVGEDEVTRRTVSRVPLGRYGTPEEVAGAIAFLCGEPAAYITGAAINVDGGGAVDPG
jgi:3-oxoacyl-[acyl-carrier protein] reductase